MDFKSIATSISAIAPTIGTALGGPVGSVVGLGVQALANVFGIDSKSDNAEEQIQNAIRQMTPEQAVELKRADKQFQLDMKRLEVDVFELEIEDKDSARSMLQATKSTTPTVLTYLFLGIAAFLVYQVFNNQLEGIDKTLVGTVIGYVFSELKQCTSFWVGSSKGSHDKTHAMATSIGKRT